MRIAIYARVSTDKQDTENQGLQLREFATKQDWSIVHEYVDYESGSKSDRPEFKRLFADASKRKFDLVLFWSLDRLTREGVLPTLQYLEQLKGYGVGFRSFTEPYFDSCGIFKDAVISIMATLAKQERIRRAERTKAGLARVRAAGRILGRPRVIQAQPADVARLRAAGHSYRHICRQLGISLGSVQRLAVS
jgi:DNA invertase Pin-like site-specific DNA recombinase